MKRKPLPIHAGMLQSTKDFTEAYKLYSQRILWFMQKRTQNAKLAEDLSSLVFVKAWKSRDSFHGGSAQAWFYQIARNVLTDYWRRNKEVSLGDNDPADERATMDADLDREMQVAELQEALQQLPPTMHAVLTMRFIEGRSTRDVARVLGLSEGNVRVLQYRALKTVRKYLHEA